MTTPTAPANPRAAVFLRPELRITGLILLFAASAVIFGIMRPDKILLATTPAGGDMGAHVLVPAYLRDNLLPDWRLIGWSNDWYAGFPIYYFYFPLPALTIVLLDVLLPYGVAFKLVTVAGLVAMPFASYYFARGMGLARPVALVGGLAGASFIFMESYTIFGGNTLSTMAGEYSFSWSFALSLVYLGMVIRNTREGRGFTVGAGVVLALTALSHLITTIIVVMASLPLLLRRSGAKAVTGAWALGFALAGFWAVPVLVRMWTYTTDMNWSPVRGFFNAFPCPNQFCSTRIGAQELWPILLLALAGLAWAIARKITVGPAVMLLVGPVVGYFLIEYFNYRKLYNARLLPYWYYAAYLFAGIAIGMAVVALVRRWSARPGLMWGAAAIAGVFVIAASAVGVSRAPAWAKWNFEGYENKAGWGEYHALMEELDALPDGRVMWEVDSPYLNKYGTPMALMLTGYWVDEHPSMEGLLFESSITTKFHFLNAAEVSSNPSNPIPGLNYHRMDFDRAVPHLLTYNVSYFVAFSEEANAGASEYGLEVLAVTEPFTIYALPESSLVDVASFIPAVWEGEMGFQDMAIEWYDDIDRLEHWVTAEGPEGWPRIDSLDSARRSRIMETGEVADIVLEDHRISFSTTAVGVPHLVKVSYFPNWTAVGAEGPYHATPSLMVVVPTQEDVVLEFRNTFAETGGMMLTGGALLGLIGWALLLRHRRRRTEAGAAP